MSISSPSRKNVLFITYDGLTDPLGQSQILPYLLGLSKPSVQITIVSCEKAQNFARNRATVAKILDDHGIRWEHLPYSKRPPILSTIFDLFRMRKLALRINARQRIDLVHCRSYLPALIGLALKRRGARFLFDMRGFWADERVDGGLWPLSNPIYKAVYRYFKRKELQFLRQADHIVALTSAARTEILTWPDCAVLGSKLSVIPCCVDLELFDGARIRSGAQSALRDRLGIREDDDVLVYLGSIGTWYMLDEMMAFFARRLAARKSAKFLFVTQDEPGQIRASARSAGIPEERLAITPAARHDVPLHVSLARFGIFFIRPTYSKMASSPTKQGEIMAMGLPIVCNSGVGDTDEIVSHYESGLLVDAFATGTYDRIATAMDTFAIDQGKIKDGAASYFGLAHGQAAYQAIYDELLGSWPA